MGVSTQQRIPPGIGLYYLDFRENLINERLANIAFLTRKCLALKNHKLSVLKTPKLLSFKKIPL